MSVINKMLRDLDQRESAQAARAQAQTARTGLVSGTQVTPGAGAPVRQRAVPALALLLACAVAALAWWAWQRSEVQPPAQPALAAATQTTVAVPAATATSAMPVLPSQPVAATSDPRALVRPPSPGLAPGAPTAMNPRTATLGAVASAPVSLAGHTAPTPTPTPTPTPAPTPAAATTAVHVESIPQRGNATPAPLQAVRSDPASPLLTALAQAQGLWNSGTHEAAIELLREALAAAERAGLGLAPGTHSAPLSALVRELARMQMAQGRVALALSLLTRLEPALAADADVWALRGNAAQRLGRHEESAAAYRAALQLRPNEARWMLGAAVSLAALGQTAAAEELAEKARASGPLSPEVASYLRQLGVSLRER